MKYFYTALVFLSALLLFVSCASIEFNVPSEGRRISPDFTGVVHAGSTNTNQEYEYLNYMGVSWILQTFYWSRIEPEQNNWNFQSYDTLVDNANNAKLKVLGVLAYDNDWIHPDQKRHYYIPPERMPDFLEYVRRTVEHFKGRVDAWCIWNEPNFFFWTGTDEEFFALARQTADAVREVDSDVILLGGAFNRNVFELPKKMIIGLFESGAMEKVDAIAFHPYELNANRVVRLNEQFRQIVEQYGFGNKIWITEIGFPTGGWYPTKVSEKKFPSAIIKTCTLLAASGVNKIFWYDMFDPVNRSKSSESFFGLVRSNEDYTSKGSEAFRLCAMYFSDSICYEYPSGQNNLPGSLNAFWFKRADGGTLVLWKDGLGSKQVALKLPGTNHVQHNIETGNESRINSEIIINAGGEPLFITWQNDNSFFEKETEIYEGPELRGR